MKSGFGEMVEWSITTVLKTVVLRGTGGSNPSLSASLAEYQQVTSFAHVNTHSLSDLRAYFISIISNQAPMLPPSIASINSEASLIRHKDFFAFHLSIPYTKKVTTLMKAR